MAFTTVDIAEPIGVFVQIGKSFFIRRQRFCIPVFCFNLQGILTEILYRSGIIEAGPDDGHVGAFAGIDAADDVIQPHHDVHDHLRRLEENRDPQEFRNVVRLHPACHRKTVVNDAGQLAVHENRRKLLHRDSPVDRRHEDVPLHIAVGQVPGSELALNLFHFRICR